jgi:hypothetical protein
VTIDHDIDANLAKRPCTAKSPYKTSKTSKGATLEYLVCTAWGFGNAYICRLKKKAMAEDGSVSTVLPATPNKSDSTNDEQCAVISNRELAESIYTAKKVFALNQCREKYKHGSSVDTAGVPSAPGHCS